MSAVAIAAIAAIGRNGVVGRDGRLPWRLPADLRFFRQTTMGHVVVLGRRTWDELGKPLPGRVHVVVSRTLAAPPHPEVLLCRDVDAALDAAIALEAERLAAGAVTRGEVFVLGGPALWRDALPRLDTLYLTRVDAAPEGDTYFPALDLTPFDREVLAHDPGPPALVFERWRRRAPAP